MKPRVFLGRLFSLFSTFFISLLEIKAKSVFFGKYLLINPMCCFQLRLFPNCDTHYKISFYPNAFAIASWSAFSSPLSKVIDLLIFSDKIISASFLQLFSCAFCFVRYFRCMLHFVFSFHEEQPNSFCFRRDTTVSASQWPYLFLLFIYSGRLSIITRFGIFTILFPDFIDLFDVFSFLTRYFIKSGRSL